MTPDNDVKIYIQPIGYISDLSILSVSDCSIIINKVDYEFWRIELGELKNDCLKILMGKEKKEFVLTKFEINIPTDLERERVALMRMIDFTSGKSSRCDE